MSGRAAFALGFAVTLAARLLVSLSRADEFTGLELYQGTLAWAWHAGMPLDTGELGIIAHNRGSVVFALLAWPLQLVFGPELICLRLVALGWSAATGGVLAVVLARAGGRVAAQLGVVLFALLPPAYPVLDVLALGSHADAVLPVCLALLVLSGTGPLSARRAGGLGAAVGFGALFSLQFLVAAPALALSWWARDRGFWRRRASLAFLPPALLLAAPIPFLTRSTKVVSRSLGERVLPEGAGGALEKLGRTLAVDLRESWLFDVFGGAFWGWVYGGALLVGLVLSAPRLRRAEPLALFCVAYPLLLLVALSFSDFRLSFVVRGNAIGSRYLLPAYPFVAAWLALGAARLGPGSGRGVVAVATAAVSAAVAAGLAGCVALLGPLEVRGAWGDALRRPPVRGTQFALFRKHFEAADATQPEPLALARRVDPDWDEVRPLTYSLFEAPPEAANASELLRTATELVPFHLAALGMRTGEQRDLDAVHRALRDLPEDALAPWFERGVGAGLLTLGLAQLIETDGAELGLYGALAGLPKRARVEVAWGAGFRLGWLFSPYHDHHLRLVAESAALPAGAFAGFHGGLAAGWRTRFVEASFVPPEPGAAAIERLLPEGAGAPFRAALAR